MNWVWIVVLLCFILENEFNLERFLKKEKENRLVVVWGKLVDLQQQWNLFDSGSLGNI